MSPLVFDSILSLISFNLAKSASCSCKLSEVKNNVVASALSAIIGHKMINDKSNNGIIFFIVLSLNNTSKYNILINIQI